MIFIYIVALILWGGSICFSATITVPDDHSTIQAAHNAASAGDTIIVKDGTYNEQVTITKDNLTFRSQNKHGAKINGGGTRDYGFLANAGADVDGVTIDGFEIFGQDEMGVGIEGPDNNNDNWRVRNISAHDIKRTGVYFRGDGHILEDSIIYMIGNKSEAYGVEAFGGTGYVIRRNQVFAISKNGMRVRQEATVNDNIIYWADACLASNTGDGGLSVYNNVLYDCIGGFKPKHMDCESSINNGYIRFWHNTLSRMRDGYVDVGENDPATSCVDVRNNVFVVDGPGINVVVENTNRVADFILDSNLYDTSGLTTYRDNAGSGVSYSTLAALKSNTGYEANGRTGSALIANITKGVSYGIGSAALTPGVSLSSSYGTQMGARNLTQTTPKVVHVSTMTAVSTTGSSSGLSRLVDGLKTPTWVSGTETPTIVFALNGGAPVTFEYFSYLGNPPLDTGIVRSFGLDRGESPTGPWTQILTDGGNTDTGASYHHFRLSSPVTTRYIRFRVTDVFGNVDLQIGEVDVWNLVPQSIGIAQGSLFYVYGDTVSGKPTNTTWSGNTFRNRTCSTLGSDCHWIKIGSNHESVGYAGGNKIQNNIFEFDTLSGANQDAVIVSGDQTEISGNTFTESGPVTMRRGSNGKFLNNRLVNANTDFTDVQVRIWGANHKVVNNLCYTLLGSKMCFQLGKGTQDLDLNGHFDYTAFNNSTLAHNVVDGFTQVAINLDANNSGSGDGATTEIPFNVKLHNNIIRQQSGTMVNAGDCEASIIGLTNNGRNGTAGAGCISLGSGNVNAAPLWTSPAGGNYSLMSSSPMIGAGIQLAELPEANTDLNGNARDSSPDLGVLEFGGGTPPASSCNSLFSSAPGYLLCEETATSCAFNATLEGGGGGGSSFPHPNYLAHTYNLANLNTPIDVSNVSQFNTAYASAGPGTVIRVTNANLNFGGTKLLNRSGSQNNPIVIISQTRLGSTFTNTQFDIRGSWIYIEGFIFNDSNIQSQDNCCILVTRNRFLAQNNSGDGSLVTRRTRQYRFSFNELVGLTDRGISVRPDGAFADTSNYGVIDHNHFHDGNQNSGNGTEPFQLGSGNSHELACMNTLFEYNYIFNALDGPNVDENEIMNTKSSCNLVRFNTVDNCGPNNCSFGVRSGDDNVFYGNIIKNIDRLRCAGDRNKYLGNFVSGGTLIRLDRGDTTSTIGSEFQGSNHPSCRDARVINNVVNTVEVGSPCSGGSGGCSTGQGQYPVVNAIIQGNRNVADTANSTIDVVTSGNSYTTSGYNNDPAPPDPRNLVEMNSTTTGVNATDPVTAPTGGTCQSVCASFGKTCVGAVDNEGATCNAIPGSVDTCQTQRTNEICICDKGLPPPPPTVDTFYVDTDCVTQGNGTTATCGGTGPWNTFSHAVTTAACNGMQQGDILEIKGAASSPSNGNWYDDTYDQPNVVSPGGSCSGVVIQNASGEHAVWDGSVEITGGWSHIGSSVYECVGTCGPAAGYPFTAWYDTGSGEQRLNLVQTERSCLTTLAAGTMTYNPATRKVCVKLSDSSNPASADYVRIPYHASAVSMGAGGADNIIFRNNPDGTGSFTITRYRDDAILMNPATNQGTVVSGLAISWTGNRGIVSEGSTGNASYTYANNVISNIGQRAIDWRQDLGQGVIENNVIDSIGLSPIFQNGCVGSGDGCMPTNTLDPMGIYINNCAPDDGNTRGTIKGNQISDMGGGRAGLGVGIESANCTYRNFIESNLFYDSTASPGGFYAMRMTGIPANQYHDRITYRNNRCDNVDRCFTTDFNTVTAQTGKRNFFYGNTCLNPNTRCYTHEDGAGIGGELWFRNNLAAGYDGVSTSLVNIPVAAFWNANFTHNGFECSHANCSGQNIVTFQGSNYQRAGDCTSGSNCVEDIGNSNIYGDFLILGTTLKLDDGSDAIDAGTELNLLTIDFEGNPRPFGPASDLGADEHTGGAQSFGARQHSIKFYNTFLPDGQGELADPDASVEVRPGGIYTIRFAIIGDAGTALHTTNFVPYYQWCDADTAPTCEAYTPLTTTCFDRALCLRNNPDRLSGESISNDIALDGRSYSGASRYLDQEAEGLDFQMVGGRQIELEYSVGGGTLLGVGDTVSFRMYDTAGSPLANYDVTPQAIIARTKLFRRVN